MKNIYNPFEEFVSDLFQRAKDLGASDIHLIATEDRFKVFVRVHGDFDLLQSYPLKIAAPVIQEIKQRAHLDLGIANRAQDGRMSIPDLSFEARVAIVPSFYGEAVCIRLFDRSRNYRIDDFGLADDAEDALKTALKDDSGLCIVAGATGSGKSTLLYSCVNEMLNSSRHIISIEDPIEMPIQGIKQIQITKDFGFQDALKAALRQDPDIILVGEIRDTETAKLCIRAVETGHLVLATIHADTVENIEVRMRGLGITLEEINRSITFSAHVKLVQTWCRHCSGQKADKEAVRDSNGCEHCYKGLAGRRPLTNWFYLPLGTDEYQGGISDPWHKLPQYALLQ